MAENMEKIEGKRRVFYVENTMVGIDPGYAGEIAPPGSGLHYLRALGMIVRFLGHIPEETLQEEMLRLEKKYPEREVFTLEQSDIVYLRPPVEEDLRRLRNIREYFAKQRREQK